MTRQTALPWHKYLPKTLFGAKIIGWVIENAMPQTRTDKGTEYEGIKQRIKKILVHSLPTEEISENVPAQKEAGAKQKGIPSDAEISDMENHGINMPINI